MIQRKKPAVTWPIPDMQKTWNVNGMTKLRVSTILNVSYLSDEITDVKRNRLMVESTITSLNLDIKKYSEEAYDKQNFNILAKANALRKAVIEKQETLKTFEKALQKLQDEYKSLKN